MAAATASIGQSTLLSFPRVRVSTPPPSSSMMVSNGAVGFRSSELCGLKIGSSSIFSQSAQIFSPRAPIFNPIIARTVNVYGTYFQVANVKFCKVLELFGNTAFKTLQKSNMIGIFKIVVLEHVELPKPLAKHISVSILEFCRKASDN